MRVADGVSFRVDNQAGGVLSGGLSLGDRADLANAGVILLKQGADLANPRYTGSALAGRVGGDFTQAGGGTLRIAAASASDYSTLAVGGSAALGGTIDVDVKSSYGGGTLANVITATGGVADKGLAVTDNSLRYAFSAVFGANGVDLTARDTGMRSIQGAVDTQAPGARGRPRSSTRCWPREPRRPNCSVRWTRSSTAATAAKSTPRCSRRCRC